MAKLNLEIILQHRPIETLRLFQPGSLSSPLFSSTHVQIRSERCLKPFCEAFSSIHNHLNTPIRSNLQLPASFQLPYITKNTSPNDQKIYK